MPRRVDAPPEHDVEPEARPEELVRLAIALGAGTVPGWSDAERRLAEAARASEHPERGLRQPARQLRRLRQQRWGARVDRVREAIAAGADPLGEAFCQL